MACMTSLGRSPQGERGLKYVRVFLRIRIISRSPQGERGLKLVGKDGQAYSSVSLPARGAWIEIDNRHRPRSAGHRRSPQGERGLKF